MTGDTFACLRRVVTTEHSPTLLVHRQIHPLEGEELGKNTLAECRLTGTGLDQTRRAMTMKAKSEGTYYIF